MRLDNWLRQATKTLEKAEIGSARLDSLIILEDELNRGKAWLLAHPEHVVSANQQKKLNKKLARRTNHEPMAYIRGFSEFYHRKFMVNKRVLEPRPESETMIELLKDLVKSSSGSKIADIGTGSGALAVTAKLEFPDAEVVATDIDPACLKVARQNAKLYHIKIEFLSGDLLARLHPTYSSMDVILANLPYVPANFYVNQAAAMEPKIAIFGGQDGLDIYRQLFKQITDFKLRPEFLFTESLPPQQQKLADIAQTAGFRLFKTQDFIQVFKPNS